MENEDKMLASAAKRRLDSMSTPRPGGWREERSPDGRMTMYVSPKGERLSREEFFDKYPQGTGGSQSIAAGMMKDVASGRSQASLPDREDLKVGVILQPRGEPWNPGHDQWAKSVPHAEWKAVTSAAEGANLSMRSRKPSLRFNELDELAQAEMSSPDFDPQVARDLLKKKAEYFGMYGKTEAPFGATDLSESSTIPFTQGRANLSREADAYNRGMSRAKPIPFPDKKK